MDISWVRATTKTPEIRRPAIFSQAFRKVACPTPSGALRRGHLCRRPATHGSRRAASSRRFWEW